jgi:hypothetical protein
VIAVDTNVLVYAHRAELPLHARAAAAVRDLAEGSAQWAIPWPCVHEFLATVTRRGGAFKSPSASGVALDQVSAWLDSPSVNALPESQRHFLTLRSLVEASGVDGARVHDARIAAICLDHGVRELLTMDRDFSRFPTLRTRSLLAN